MMSPQEIRVEALVAAVDMFGDGHDVGYVLHVADTFFVPFITSGARVDRAYYSKEEK